MSRPATFLLLGALLILLGAANLFTGSVALPAADVAAALLGRDDVADTVRFIVLDSRLPQTWAAVLAGAALAVAGLMLQTSFHNPLAGPSILGITSGASLGVALVMLGSGGAIGGLAQCWGAAASLIAAFAGSAAVTLLLMAMAAWLRNNLMLLIAGIMVGYLASSVITLLNYFADADGLQGYVMWGMGSFTGVTLPQIPLFALLTIAGLLLAACLAKPLNLLQLGENYARNLGVSLTAVRRLLLGATCLLTATATAYCGPVAFIGIAVPHMARLMVRSADHRLLLPATALTGSVACLLCNLICIMPARTVLPLNGVTPLIGVPVILYVIFRRR